MKIRPKEKSVISAKRKTHNAFTFIELCIVIIIIGILIGVALPSFRKSFNSLQLNNFSAELQNFMRYLRERAIVTGKVIYLNIDNEKKLCTAQFKDTPSPFKTSRIPESLNVELEPKEIFFYPDGQIDKVTITLTNPENQRISLTTKGIFGGVKVSEGE